MQASCSVRLLQPFIRFAAADAAYRDLVPNEFWSVQASERVSLLDAHVMLNRGAERKGDDQLGLKLGSTMAFGSGGAFDYVVRSATTLREAILVASRYSRLLTDSFRISLEMREDRALLRLEDDVSFPRHAADFALAALYRLHVADQIPPARLECWLPYSAPRELDAYERAFPGVALRFGAPFHGIALDRALADSPMVGSDPALHSILRTRVDSLVAEIATTRSFSAVVRRLVSQEIPSGTPSAESVARALHMSRRTLTRRLEEEHTTFNAEFDAVRKKLSLDHVADVSVPLSDIAFLVGFSHVESFHRAFKRWTGHTPLAYRAAQASERQ